MDLDAIISAQKHAMTEPRKTPRSDGQRLEYVRYIGAVRTNEGPFVLYDFARALEIETQELAELCHDLAEALKEANGSFYGSPKSQARIDAVLARHRANQQPTT